MFFRAFFHEPMLSRFAQWFILSRALGPIGPTGGQRCSRVFPSNKFSIRDPSPMDERRSPFSDPRPSVPRTPSVRESALWQARPKLPPPPTSLPPKVPSTYGNQGASIRPSTMRSEPLVERVPVGEVPERSERGGGTAFRSSRATLLRVRIDIVTQGGLPRWFALLACSCRQALTRACGQQMIFTLKVFAACSSGIPVRRSTDVGSAPSALGGSGSLHVCCLPHISAPVGLSVSPSVSGFVSLPPQSLRLSFSLSLSVHPSIRPSLCLFVPRSLCVSVFVSLPLRLFVHLSLSLSFSDSLSLGPSVSPSLGFCLCVTCCLAVCHAGQLPGRLLCGLDSRKYGCQVGWIALSLPDCLGGCLTCWPLVCLQLHLPGCHHVSAPRMGASIVDAPLSR